MQWLGFTLLSWLSVVPRMAREGTNIVTETYRLGTLRFWAGVDPYALPLLGGDRYEYSPFFCLLYSPFAFLPLKIQALSWALFNCGVFWAGVCLWVRIEKKNFWPLLLAFIATSVELNISVLYQQINALLIGLSLIALHLYKERKFAWAGFLITLATNLKTIPVIFALPLFFPLRKEFFKGCLLGSFFTLFFPVLFVGWNKNIFFHEQWIERLLSSFVLLRGDELNIASLFGSFSLAKTGVVLQISILILSMGLLVFSSLRAKQLPNFYWPVIAGCCLLLVSPRTESPTFVFMAPGYVLLTKACLDDERSKAGAILLALVIVFFCTTFIFTDAWPRHAWRPLGPGYPSKTLGTLLLWLLAVIGLLRGLGLLIICPNKPMKNEVRHEA